MKQILPIMLGSDINAYSMARLFHEAYNVKSLVLTTEVFNATKNTNILDVKVINNFHKKEVFLNELNKIYKKNKNKKIILISCGETYSNLLCDNKKELSKFIVPYFTNKEMMNRLINKEEFYKVCEEYGLSYPKTYIYSKGDKLKVPFSYPVVLKPDSSVYYQMINFEGKKKVFIINEEKELKEALNKIYKANYKGNMIIQEYIPGKDTNMFVLNCYSDRFGKVKMMSLGNILLEEKAPLYIGNYAAITDAYNENMFKQVKEFLEKIKYVGISNFDIKYDERDKKYKFFEINLRQGRSSFYVYGSGINFAKLIVDDYVYSKDLKLIYAKKEFLYLNLYKYFAFKFIDKDIIKSIKHKKVYNPYIYDKDKSLKRSYAYFKLQLRQYKVLKKYNK